MIVPSQSTAIVLRGFPIIRALRTISAPRYLPSDSPGWPSRPHRLSRSWFSRHPGRMWPRSRRSVTPIRTALGGGTVAGANGAVQRRHRRPSRDQLGRRAGRALAAPNNSSGQLLQRQLARAASSFSTPGTGFQVSANAGIAADRVRQHRPGVPEHFAPFSPQRLFTRAGLERRRRRTSSSPAARPRRCRAGSARSSPTLTSPTRPRSVLRRDK